ncbi:MAG: efflux RND transporter periplasmic adaptor subunit [Pseudodesulfovibrio sp.]
MKSIVKRMIGSTGIRVAVPVLIVLLACMGAWAMIATAPKARRMAPAAAVPVVEAAVFARGAHPVTVSVMGAVVAASEISLAAQVEGRIVAVSDAFVPGGFFRKGEEILHIDPSDYELALREARAAVTDARYDLKVELGYQNVAAREWKLLEKSSKASGQDTDLALRKPHLEKAQADLEAARAKEQQAELNLARTTITAPFPAVIESVAANVGAMVSSQQTLATLVGTDEFWVQATVPVDRLGRIRLPSPDGAPGAEATIVSGSGDASVTRRGRVVRLLPSLESEGRMARVLVAVADPLNIAGDPALKPLLLGSYVKVEIDGGEVAGSYAIPRKAFRDNSRLWILGADGALEIRDVNPVWRDAETVLLTDGLADGERVVLSSLTAPVAGMRLATADEARAASAETNPEGGHEQ